jgi:hypothetical protein
LTPGGSGLLFDNWRWGWKSRRRRRRRRSRRRMLWSCLEILLKRRRRWAGKIVIL